MGPASAEPAPPRAGRRTAVALVLAALVLAGGLAAWVYLVPTHAASRNGPVEIDVIPSAGSRSACIVGTPGEARPTLALAEGVLQANTYSVPNGTVGHVGMCYNATTDAMFAYANWSKVGGAGGWFSYPQITYGVNEYLGAFTTYTNQSPAWELPQTVASAQAESLWVTATYALRTPSPSDVDGYDLSFDDFLSEGLPPTFDVPPFVEVEIFLAHNISYPPSWTHWSTPTLVNSTVAVEPWAVAYWCHGADNGSNGNLSFDFSYDGQSSQGLVRGTLGVNLSAVLGEVEALMPGAACWEGPTGGFSRFYLDEEVLGSEDGADGGASFSYNWTVSAFCLHTEVRAPNGSNVGCGGPTGPDGPAARSDGRTLARGPPLPPTNASEQAVVREVPPRVGSCRRPAQRAGTRLRRRPSTVYGTVRCDRRWTSS